MAFPVLLAPISEQHALLDHLDAACRRHDILVQSSDTAIVRLTEYRSALISAAVTGKIDVRGEVGAANV